MLFLVISIFVPLVVYFATPVIVFKFTGKKPAPRALLFIASVLFFISWYLPSPDIQGQYTAFTTHFVGGGMFSAFLWLYIKKQLAKDYSWWQDLVAIYLLVSALGVANELFELLVTQLHLAKITPTDTWWDLLANTLGALLVWLVYTIFRKR